MKLLHVLALLPSLISVSATAATLTVTTTSDEVVMGDGCSLREAILAANDDIAVMDCVAGSGPDTIAFDIPGPGVHQIVIEADLPAISASLAIDGMTQAGSSCPLGQQIELTDGQAGIGSSGPYAGLTFMDTAGSSFVRGLRIIGIAWTAPSDFFPVGTGIEARGLDGLTIQCNVLGNVYGVLISGSNVLIGADGDGVRDDKEGNWFFDYQAVGLYGTSEVQISGNRVGNPPLGLSAVLPQQVGLNVTDSVGVVIGTTGPSKRAELGNIIDSEYGIYLDGYQGPEPLDVVVRGNRIGVDETGHFLPNTRVALLVDFSHRFTGAARIQIGGPLNLAGPGFTGNIFAGRESQFVPYAVVLSSVPGVVLTMEGNAIFSTQAGDFGGSQSPYGVSVSTEAPVTFRDNLIHGFSTGIRQFNVDSQLEGSQGNCFLENELGALGVNSFDLRDNWWGSSDGPGGVGQGNGDPVSSNVIYEPFLTQPPASCSLIGLVPRSAIQIPVLSPWALALLGLIIVSLGVHQSVPRGRGKA